MSKTDKRKILIIDDDLSFYHEFRQIFEEAYSFKYTLDSDKGLEILQQDVFDVLLLDLDFKGKGYTHGLDVILPSAQKKIKGKYPIIVCTNDNNPGTFQRAVNNGATFLLRKSEYKPFTWDERIRHTIDDFRTKNQEKLEKEIAKPQEDGFISASIKVQELKNRLRLLPQFSGKVTVLFLGESGVGKEVAAKFLHQSKAGNKLPFVDINLSAVSEKLLESELFGHVKGAFTDAHTDKMGLFEKARDGTLFLDEIGEVSTEIQVKLLRVLQEKEFRRVGGDKSIKLEAQVVFATNKDLGKAIEDKTFRLDFYERISTISFQIPPLRERTEDILPLLDYFFKLEEVCPPSLHFHGKKAKDCFTPAALSKLYQYHWPGNIRELRSSLQKILFEIFISGKKQIDEQILPNRFNQSSSDNVILPGEIQNITKTSNTTAPQNQNINWSIDKQTAYSELEKIEKALITSGGRKFDTAELLGLKGKQVDQTLRYKVQKYFKDFPELFTFFPTIRKVYKLK